MSGKRERTSEAAQSPGKQYYMISYDKCSNCGKLLYGEGFEVRYEDAARRFCSGWCEDWYEQRAAASEGSEVGSADRATPLAATD